MKNLYPSFVVPTPRNDVNPLFCVFLASLVERNAVIGSGGFYPLQKK